MPSTQPKAAITDSINIQSTLLNTKDRKSSANASFVVSKTVHQELKLILFIFIKIAGSNVAELFPQILSNIFIGHLNNAPLLLSSCGLARTFCNVLGMAQAWSFSSALFILIPQCLGANKPELMAIYVQRAFYVCMLVAMIATIIQFFGGEIMCLIGEPKEFCPIISNYCRCLIPLIYGTVWLTIAQRVGQSLNFNTHLFYSVLIPALLAIPLNYLFVFHFGFGYIGTALVIDICVFMAFLLTISCLIYKGYGWIFVPLPFKQVIQYNGMKEYILLALPGLVQSSLSWTVGEMMVALSGFIANPSVIVASTVVCSSLMLFLIMISVGMSNAINIRLGKYIGSGLVFGAKMVAKCAVGLNTITMIFLAVFLFFMRELIIKMFTQQEDVVAMASSMVAIVVIPQMITNNFYITLSGAFRGLGYPTIIAVAVFISHYCISLPLAGILLFYVGIREYSSYGVYTLWLCVALGYFLCGSILLVILIFKIDLKKAASQSLNRIKRTMNGYGSIEESNSNKIGHSKALIYDS
eukprot:283344_1